MMFVITKMLRWTSILFATLWLSSALCQTAQILPTGRTQFLDNNGTPLANGQVYTFVPGTTTPKTTWSDPNQVSANPNPVPLDAGGTALIWGSGVYRTIVQSFTNGNYVTVFDQLTSSGTVGSLGPIAQDTVIANFSGTTNSPSAYPMPSCTSGQALTYSTVTHSLTCGPNASAGTGLVLNNGTFAVQQLVPGGRLTLISATPVMAADAINAQTLYYAPYHHPFVPIYNGTVDQLYQYTSGPADNVGLSIAMAGNAAWAASTVYDVFVGLNPTGGAVTLCTGPAWASKTARTAALSIFDARYTNASSMLCQYSTTQSFTCLPNQCTYLGSFFTSGNGEVTMNFSWANNAIAGLWNMYNRVDVLVKGGDTSATWPYNTNTLRCSNGNCNDSVTVLEGIAEEPILGTFVQNIDAISVSGIPSSGAGVKIAIGLNGIVNASFAANNNGNQVICTVSSTACQLQQNLNLTAQAFLPALMGVTTLTCLEQVTGGGTISFEGGEPNMVLSARIRG